MKQIRLIYKRIPNRTLVRYDIVLGEEAGNIIAYSTFEGLRSPIRVDNKIVIANGFYTIYFVPIGGNHDILKVYDQQDRFKGYYCDVLDYVRFEGDTLEMLDLFLDVWIFPDNRYFVLDRNELEDALQHGHIERGTYTKANVILSNMISGIEKGTFPPDFIKDYNISHTMKEEIEGIGHSL